MSSIYPFSEVLSTLKQEGYSVSFSLAEDGLKYSAGTSIIWPEDFTIDGLYKVTSLFIPDEEVTIYAISSDLNHVKGVYISSEDIANNSLSPEMANKFDIESKSYDITKKNQNSTQSTVRATRQRPEGTRALNQEMLTFDTDALISQIKSEEAWSRSDRNSLTIFKNDSLCMVIVGLVPLALSPFRFCKEILFLKL